MVSSAPGRARAPALGRAEQIRKLFEMAERGGRIALAPAGAEAKVSPVTLVGRRAELDRLRAALTGGPRVVLLAGEAGIGKTRLLRAFADEARRSAMVLEGYAESQEIAVPYQIFVTALRSLLRRDGMPLLLSAARAAGCDLSPLLPELRDAVALSPPAGEAGARQRLFEGVYAILRELARKRPLLLALDDVQWADRGSDLLRHLARAAVQDRLLLVASYRSDELHGRHPLSLVHAELRRQRLAETIELPALSAQECTSLATATFGARLEEAALAVLVARSDGNPFVLEELVKALKTRGQAASDVPETLRDAVVLRIARLSPGARTILPAAAALGREFSYDLFARIVARSERQALQALRELVEQQLLAGIGEDRFRFRHELVREVIYGDVIAPERRRLHRAIGQALEDLEPSRAEELAYHWRLARDATRAARYAELAADRAFASLSHAEALNWLQQAIESSEDDDGPARLRLLDKSARAAHEGGRPQDAERYLTEALALAEHDQGMARSLRLRMGQALAALGRAEEAIAAYSAALSRPEPGDAAFRARALLAIARLHHAGRRSADARPFAEEAFGLAEPLDDDVLACDAGHALAIAMVEMGDRSAEQLARRLVRRGLAGGLPQAAALAYDALANVHLRLLDMRGAAGDWERELALCSTQDMPTRETVCLFCLSSAMRNLGEGRRSAELAERALEKARDLGNIQLEAVATATLGELAADQGQWRRARELAVRAFPLAERSGEPVAISLAALVRARVAEFEGDHELVARMVRRAEEARRPMQSYFLYGSLARFAVPYFVGRGDAARAREFVVVQRRMVEQLPTSGAEAQLAYSLGHLEEAAGRRQEAARHFEQARRLFREAGLVYDSALADGALARALLAAGDGRAANQALLRARRLFRQAGAAGELARVEALRAGLAERGARAASSLTAREREVAELVTEGLFQPRDR